jgi:hypothetical protein
MASFDASNNSSGLTVAAYLARLLHNEFYVIFDATREIADMRLFTTAIALAATLAATAPAAAVVTAFASFSPIGDASNVRWVNADSNGNAAFYTIATGVGTEAAPRAVTFTFLQNAFNSVGPVTANWQLNGTVTDTIATINGADIVQRNIAGSFSFTSTSPITLGSTTYANGSNLLSGTFTNATIEGARSSISAGFTGVTPVSTITYLSDFLTFQAGSDYGFAISLTEILPSLNALPTAGVPTRALRTFRADASGQFSSDPAPIPNVPEPAVWLQLIAGFGLVGAAARRRTKAIA